MRTPYVILYLKIRNVNIMLIISQLGNITNLIGASGMVTVYKDEYVGFTFPKELKAMLRETNGDNWLLLSAERIISHVKGNREMFPEYLDPDEFEEKVNRFVFFATNGCGDYYCYRVLDNGETDTSAIYIWEHELFEVREVAKDIADLITKYYNDEV